MQRGGIEMKNIRAFLLPLIVFAAVALTAPAMAGAVGMTKTENGIKAYLNVDPSRSMVELYLADAKTQDVLTVAKVRLKAILPDGTLVEKDLIGMKMGPVFSFMNTVDLSLKGRYSFDIIIDTGEKTATLKFSTDIQTREGE